MSDVKPPKKVWWNNSYGWRPEDGHTRPLYNVSEFTDDPLGCQNPNESAKYEYYHKSHVDKLIRLAVLEERLKRMSNFTNVRATKAQIAQLKKEIAND